MNNYTGIIAIETKADDIDILSMCGIKTEFSISEKLLTVILETD